MDAERIAGYQVTGRQGSIGRQATTGSQATTAHQEAGGWERTAFGAVPNQRGEPGQPGRPANVAGMDSADGADAAAIDDADAAIVVGVAADAARVSGSAADAMGVTGAAADAAPVGGIDVRCEPLVVRDGCSPDRIPAGRWPSDGSLVRSEQFAVNEAIAQRGLFALHAPPGTGVAEVFGDLVAAIITERARRIAELPSPAAAFGESRAWSTHRVAAPNPALTGLEIVLAAPEPSALTAHGLPPIGAGWREAATAIDYFASTARLSDGVGAWAMLTARLGDGAANRAFAERWWRGAIRGTDVLFPAGESMAAALRRLKQQGPAVDWPTAVAGFRAALARAENLASERSRVAAAVTRISDLEQACEEASCFAEVAQARLVKAIERQPSVRAALAAAEEEHRARLADLGAHELGRPAIATVTADGKAALRSSAALSVALAGGLRRHKSWRDWSVARRELRAACASAKARRDAAAERAATLDATLVAAQAAVTETTALVTRLEAEIGPLAEAVAAARQQWGDHVPDGPSQAETEDLALIEWRETSAPWADDDYATARAEVFLAALELHKALITAQADVFAANLGALMDLLSSDRADAFSATGPLIPAQAKPAGAQNAFRAEDDASVAVDADGAALTAALELDGIVRIPGVEPRGTARVPAVDAHGTTRADGPTGGDAAAHADGAMGSGAATDATRMPDGGEAKAAGSAPTEQLTPAIAAAWQTLFLLVPVVHVPFGAIGALFADLGPARLGWLLADHAERLPGWQARAILGPINHAVFAGDTAATAEPVLAADNSLASDSATSTSGAITTSSVLTADSALRLAERAGRYGTWLRPGPAGPAGPAAPASSTGPAEQGKPTDGAGRIWVGTPLRVVRGLDRATIDLRNELAYDGLLVSDRD